MKKISIILPCYNEAANLDSAHDRITSVMATLPAYDYEIIFVDNASTDDSLPRYHAIVRKNPRVSVLLMSRNFGSSQPSFLAGMHHASGDGVVLLDGDLQDPPELICEFIKKWEDGYDVVYGVRRKRKGSLLRRFGYACFYRIFKALSYLEIPLDAGDFGLMDRKVVSIITQLPEKDIYLRGLRAWVGFKQVGVPYVRHDRVRGITSNSFRDNIVWFKKAVFNFSYKPLEYVTHLAFATVALTSVAACIYLYLYWCYGAPQGFLTLLMVMFGFGSLQLLAISIIGEYVMRIFSEIKARPRYVIAKILSSQGVSEPHFAPATKPYEYRVVSNNQEHI